MPKKVPKSELSPTELLEIQNLITNRQFEEEAKKIETEFQTAIKSLQEKIELLDQLIEEETERLSAPKEQNETTLKAQATLKDAETQKQDAERKLAALNQQKANLNESLAAVTQKLTFAKSELQLALDTLLVAQTKFETAKNNQTQAVQALADAKTTLQSTSAVLNQAKKNHDIDSKVLTNAIAKNKSVIDNYESAFNNRASTLEHSINRVMENTGKSRSQATSEMEQFSAALQQELALSNYEQVSPEFRSQYYSKIPPDVLESMIQAETQFHNANTDYQNQLGPHFAAEQQTREALQQAISANELAKSNLHEKTTDVKRLTAEAKVAERALKESEKQVKVARLKVSKSEAEQKTLRGQINQLNNNIVQLSQGMSNTISSVQLNNNINQLNRGMSNTISSVRPAVQFQPMQVGSLAGVVNYGFNLNKQGVSIKPGSFQIHPIDPRISSPSAQLQQRIFAAIEKVENALWKEFVEKKGYNLNTLSDQQFQGIQADYAQYRNADNLNQKAGELTQSNSLNGIRLSFNKIVKHEITPEQQPAQTATEVPTAGPAFGR